MGLFSKIVKGVGNVIKDSVMIGVEPVKSSVNSVTNKETIKTSYSTGAGKAIGGTAQAATDSTHLLLKSYANNLLGGIPDKLADTIRDDEHKSTVFSYENQQTFDTGLLSKLERGSKGGAVILGNVAATAVAASQEGKGKGETGGSQQLISNSNNNVSALGNLVTKFQEFGKSPIGQAAGSMLGNVLQNVLSPKQVMPQQTQQLIQNTALAGSSQLNGLPNVNTAALPVITAAALGDKFTVTGNVGLGGGGSGDPWYKTLPWWGWALIGGVPVLLFFIWLFTKKR